MDCIKYVEDGITIHTSRVTRTGMNQSVFKLDRKTDNGHITAKSFFVLGTEMLAVIIQVCQKLKTSKPDPQ